MKCMRCKSERVMKFIDGFGVRRIFCRDCWLSVPENILIKFNSQKNLNEFKTNSYYRFIEVR
jgi:hypothetical protein